MALAWGLRITLFIGVKVIAIEGDFKLIIDVVKGLNRINWSINGIIKDTFRLLFSFDSFLLNHIYREGNCVVDAMVALSLTLHRLRCYNSLPPNIRLLIEGEINNAISHGHEIH